MDAANGRGQGRGPSRARRIRSRADARRLRWAAEIATENIGANRRPRLGTRIESGKDARGRTPGSGVAARGAAAWPGAKRWPKKLGLRPALLGAAQKPASARRRIARRPDSAYEISCDSQVQGGSIRSTRRRRQLRCFGDIAPPSVRSRFVAGAGPEAEGRRLTRNRVQAFHAYRRPGARGDRRGRCRSLLIGQGGRGELLDAFGDGFLSEALQHGVILGSQGRDSWRGYCAERGPPPCQRTVDAQARAAALPRPQPARPAGRFVFDSDNDRFIRSGGGLAIYELARLVPPGPFNCRAPPSRRGRTKKNLDRSSGAT